MKKLIFFWLALTLGMPAQTPAISAIANGASFLSGISPGSIVAIFGSHFGNTLANTSVTVGGLSAPVLLVTDSQINAKIPVNVPLGQTTLGVIVQQKFIATMNTNISRYAPAIFAIDGTGAGHGVFTDGHGRLIPVTGAIPGQAITAWLVGLGATPPQVPEDSQGLTGSPLSRPPPVSSDSRSPYDRDAEIPMVSVGGIAATVESVGFSTTVGGVYEVNFVVPNVGAGDQKVVIEIEGVRSPPVLLSVGTVLTSINRGTNDPAPKSLEVASPSGSASGMLAKLLTNTRIAAATASSTSPVGIVYTCDRKSIDDSLCAALNQTVAGLYSRVLTNANANIFIGRGDIGAFGANRTYRNSLTYSDFRDLLTASATDDDDTTALLNVPLPEPAIFKGENIWLTNANLRALGRPATFGCHVTTQSDGTTSIDGTCVQGDGACLLTEQDCYDGVIIIKSDSLLQYAYYRTSLSYSQCLLVALTSPCYDFYTDVQHETDEVLGTLSCAFGCPYLPGGTGPFPADLFRYHGDGTRSFLVNESGKTGNDNSCFSNDTANACFSIDGIVKRKYNNSNTKDDPGDWWNNPNSPQVQDAVGTPGVFDLDISPSAEIMVLDVVGFTLVGAPAKAVVTSGLVITPAAPYALNQTLAAQFTITNKGGTPITLQTLTAGGLLSGVCPGDCPDFTHISNITLTAGQSYNYSGTFRLKQSGTYDFFPAYQTSDGTWNTTVPANPGLTQIVELTVPAVNLTPQTIAFGALSDVALGVAPFVISATASSGLFVTFASTTASVCTVIGSTVTIVAAGACSITAIQSGNSTYAPAVPVSRGFTVTARSTVATLVDLGTLGGSAVAWGLNASGQVVGESTLTVYSGASHGFLYSQGIMSDLGSFGGTYNSPFGINSAGQIAGTWVSSVFLDHAFLYSDGVITSLGTSGSTAAGINSLGQVVGSSPTAGGMHAVLYSNGSTIDLGTLGGSSSVGAGINDAGQITGYSFTASGTHAFLYSGASMTDLGTLGGRSIDNSYGRAISATGQVVGDSTTVIASHAFLYTAGSMIDLGTLGDHAFASTAFGINSAGQVVGYSSTAVGPSAFVYSKGTMIDLNSLLSPNSSLHLEVARAINDSGQIVGYSDINGVSHAWLLTLPALLPSCDINGDSLTNVADVQLMINEALGVRPSTDDLNRDGVVNVADVQKVINAALGLFCVLP